MSELQGSLNIVSEYKINSQSLEDVGHFAHLHDSHHVELYILVKKSHKRETVFVDLSIIARAPPSIQRNIRNWESKTCWIVSDLVKRSWGIRELDRQYQIPACGKWQDVQGRICPGRSGLRTTRWYNCHDFITGFYCHQYVDSQTFIHGYFWFGLPNIAMLKIRRAPLNGTIVKKLLPLFIM